MTHTITQQVEIFLQGYPKKGEPRVAVFDCDGTLIKGDIGESMFYHQLEHFLLRVSPAEIWPDHPKGEELKNLYESLTGLPPEKAFHDRRFVSFAEMILNWYFGQLDEGKTGKACSDIVRLFAGFTHDEVREIARDTLKKELELPIGVRMLGNVELPVGIRYIRETIDLLHLVRERGFDVWVVSGSNRWSVEAVCESIGVPADRVIGIDLVERNGTFEDLVRVPVPVLEGKVAALKGRGAARPLLVASDSTYDIPLFDYSSGLKILVRSSDDRDFFAAGRVSRDEHWLVIESPSYLTGSVWPTQQ